MGIDMECGKSLSLSRDAIVRLAMTERMTAWCLILATTTLPFTFGCGPQRPKPVTVSGIVMIDGRPLEGGFIRVVPEGGRPAGGAIGEDGRFVLGCFGKEDGCLTGTHKVEVQGVKMLSETKRQWLAPKKYASTGTSGLTITIEKPTHALKIDLTWAGSPEKGPFVEEIAEEFPGRRRPGSRGGR
jgi:hypothetical protein